MKPFVAPDVTRMTFEQAVHACANAGMSRYHAAEHLSMSHAVFNDMLQGLGPVNWPSRDNSVRVIERIKARRGLSTPALAAGADAAREAFSRKRHRTLRGVTASLEELIETFAPPVSIRTIRDRLAKGIEIEDAFFATAYQRCVKKGVKQKRLRYTYRGFTGTLREIYQHFGCPVSYPAFRFRVQRGGWSVDKALSTPLKGAAA
ncbi:hypothetical protein [uncultured Pseudomonas sp.]|uniref:hypothetical protein n=1 Tax=uncultured Pseudomonas sp. TaxID=114707 RepID=UPI0025CFCC47|nr:hypothetical protein [uncultured Pseudomonas sp.]